MFSPVMLVLMPEHNNIPFRSKFLCQGTRLPFPPKTCEEGSSLFQCVCVGAWSRACLSHLFWVWISICPASRGCFFTKVWNMDQVSIRPVRSLTDRDVFTWIESILWNHIGSLIHTDGKASSLNKDCSNLDGHRKSLWCNHLSLSEKEMAAKRSSSLDWDWATGLLVCGERASFAWKTHPHTHTHAYPYTHTHMYGCLYKWEFHHRLPLWRCVCLCLHSPGTQVCCSPAHSPLEWCIRPPLTPGLPGPETWPDQTSGLLTMLPASPRNRLETEAPLPALPGGHGKKGQAPFWKILTDILLHRFPGATAAAQRWEEGRGEMAEAGTFRKTDKLSISESNSFQSPAGSDVAPAGREAGSCDTDRWLSRRRMGGGSCRLQPVFGLLSQCWAVWKRDAPQGAGRAVGSNSTSHLPVTYHSPLRSDQLAGRWGRTLWSFFRLCGG